MTPADAVGEDLRRVGVALIIAGIVGGMLKDQVPPIVAGLSAIFGLALAGIGYWAHHRERQKEPKR